MKEIILSVDSGTISNAPELLSQLQKDSALFRREVLLSQEEASSLTELHLNTLNNYFTQIGVWFGVASVIFLVFGFFGIFKIEEAKAEAKRTLKEVEEKGETATGKINNLQSQASSLNATITTIRQDNANFIADKTKDVNELIERINKTQTNSEAYFNHAKELVQSLEAKNEKYDWSVETMENQLERLDNLLNKLKDFMENNGKEESDE